MIVLICFASFIVIHFQGHTCMVFQDQRCMLFPFVNTAGGRLLHDDKPHLHGGQFILHFVYV